MKIIIGSESFLPNISGVSISAHNLADSLTKKGYKIYVFAPDHPRAVDFDKKHKYQVIRFKSVNNPFRKGFKVAFLPKKEIFKKAANIKPDLIHLEDPTSICSALKSFALKNNIPVVISNHFSLDYLVSYLPILKIFSRQIKFITRKWLAKYYNNCDAVICPTITVRKDLIYWGVKKPVEAISNGVDLERFYTHLSSRDIFLKYHLPRNPIVLYVGRLDKDKHLDVLINAYGIVAKTTSAHFLFVGSGDESQKLKKQAEDLELEGKISWVGAIDPQNDNLVKIYQAAMIFVNPCPFETQSIVTLEAMASGLPIIGPNSGAIPELVKNKVNGYLFNRDDSKDLASKLISLLENPNQVKKMGEMSLKRISSHQTSISIDKTIQVYEKILKSN